MFSSHFKNISQNGSFPQIGVKIKKYSKPPPGNGQNSEITLPKPNSSTPRGAACLHVLRSEHLADRFSTKVAPSFEDLIPVEHLNSANHKRICFTHISLISSVNLEKGVYKYIHVLFCVSLSFTIQLCIHRERTRTPKITFIDN